MTSTATGTRTDQDARADQDSRADEPWLWNVVLIDDDDHTYEYVIRLAQAVFSRSFEQGYEVARTVDTHGRAVLCTVHKELAELKRDQVHAFGPDRLLDRSAGAMSAMLEPARKDESPG